MSSDSTVLAINQQYMAQSGKMIDVLRPIFGPVHMPSACAKVNLLFFDPIAEPVRTPAHHVTREAAMAHTCV